MEIPVDLIERAAQWEELHRWERSELGKALRRLGLTYGEIRELIPVPKATLSDWCREIRLSDDQVEAIKERTGPHSRVGIPVDTQWRRRQQIDRIRCAARMSVSELIQDPLWVAGTVLYWAEGGKTRRQLEMANTDHRVLKTFIAWTHRFHDSEAALTLSLHLHEGNDETLARQHWGATLGLPNPTWSKSFIKPKGTGHRKNRLPFGVCRVYVHCSADAFERTMAWIGALSTSLA
jgi:hypothetical protein